jgi:hypothetical protein
MKDIENVHKTFIETDALIACQETSASSSSDRNKWALIRDANSQAYFALMFAQFEDVVNTFAEGLIRKRRSSTSWGHRRAWEIIDVKDVSRVPFMNRVALLCDKSGSDYKSVNDYYKLRCKIDHGDTVPSIDVSRVRDDLLAIAKRMKIKA